MLPPATFWNTGPNIPSPAPNGSVGPLGVQVLALAYKSGGPWNESGYASPEFDALLEKALATPDGGAPENHGRYRKEPAQIPA